MDGCVGWGTRRISQGMGDSQNTKCLASDNIKGSFVLTLKALCDMNPLWVCQASLEGHESALPIQQQR